MVIVASTTLWRRQYIPMTNIVIVYILSKHIAKDAELDDYCSSLL